MTFYLLIAFPFALLLIWLAVSRGLRPLQQISQRIAGRSPDDLSATGLDPRYAELEPLVYSLDALLSQLRGKVKREHAFVQEAAHDLRTPMAVMSAQAHVLVLALRPEDRRDAEQRLDQAIARASHLIEQLLQLAQIDSERPLDVVTLDIAQAVRQELAMVAPAAMARKLELCLESPDALLHALELHAFKSILHGNNRKQLGETIGDRPRFSHNNAC